ncbi:MAG: hypothetical protein GF353_22780 [Candidatus Lokiarchaeota archaeon]|nr:hypothetical protein [Candidatus Lokiarchaeota archaeon]
MFLTSNDDFKKVLLEKPHCILGKKGITEEFVSHINKFLKRYKTIKVKALKSIATKSNTKELAQQVANASNSSVLDVRGKTFIISISF